MINKQEKYVKWVLLIQELKDTKEHLSNLIGELYSNKDFGEVEFHIHMTHLNRIYNNGNHVVKISDKEFANYSKFPEDIKLESD